MWKLDYTSQGCCYMKAIVDNQKEVVLIVNILSDEAINKIIEAHNESIQKQISKQYELGLREGFEMAKKNSSKKDKIRI